MLYQGLGAMVFMAYLAGLVERANLDMLSRVTRPNRGGAVANCNTVLAFVSKMAMKIVLRALDSASVGVSRTGVVRSFHQGHEHKVLFVGVFSFERPWVASSRAEQAFDLRWTRIGGNIEAQQLSSTQEADSVNGVA